MNNIQTLRSFVNERLSVAVEEIFVVVERILTEYEDQAFSSKQQIEQQQRILDVVLKPDIRLHKTDIPEQRQRIVKMFEEENDDDDDDEEEDFPGSPALGCKDHSLERVERSLDIMEEPPSPLQIEEGQGETGWSTLRLADVKSRGDTVSDVSSEVQDGSPSAVQKEPGPPEIKEEPEEVLIIPEMADTSTLPDRKPQLDTLEWKPQLNTLSAVTTLPDTVSNTTTTAAPRWPTDMTPAEPLQRMDVDVSMVPGMERVDCLADRLVGLRTETSRTLNYKQSCGIIALWLNLLPYDQIRVSFSPLACRSGGGRWPDCGRLVASVLAKLCDIHKCPKYHGSYTLKWMPVLRDYNKIRQLLVSNSVIMEGSNLALFNVDQATFVDWHGKRMQTQECSVHLQGFGISSVGVTTSQAMVTQMRVFPPHTSDAFPTSTFYYVLPQNLAVTAVKPAPFTVCKKCTLPAKRENGHVQSGGYRYCPEKTGVPLDQWRADVSQKRKAVNDKRKGKRKGAYGK